MSCCNQNSASGAIGHIMRLMSAPLVPEEAEHVDR